MGVFLGILALVAMIMMWIALGLIMIVAFFVFFGVPYMIVEGICYCTVNNIINVVAKIPIIGPILGFLLTIPVSILSLGVTVYAGFLGILGPACWCFMGVPGGKEQLIAAYGDSVLEPAPLLAWMGCDWNLNPAYHFMNLFGWIYKYSGITCSIFPWFDTKNIVEEGGLLIFILKMIFMAIPYTCIFIIPFIFILWGFTRPIVGAMGRLPAFVVLEDD